MKKGILSIAALAFVLLISFSSLSVKPAATATENRQRRQFHRKRF